MFTELFDSPADPVCMAAGLSPATQATLKLNPLNVSFIILYKLIKFQQLIFSCLTMDYFSVFQRTLFDCMYFFIYLSLCLTFASPGESVYSNTKLIGLVKFIEYFAIFLSLHLASPDKYLNSENNLRKAFEWNICSFSFL